MHLVVRGPRDAADVWEDYARPARWSRWSPQIRSVRATGARIAPGTTGTVHGPAGLRVVFRVTAVDEDARTWRWVVRCGPVLAALEHRVVAVTGGCRTDLLLEASPLVRLAYSPAARVALRRLAGGAAVSATAPRTRAAGR